MIETPAAARKLNCENSSVGQRVIEHDRIAGIWVWQRRRSPPASVIWRGGKDVAIGGAIEGPHLIARIDRLDVLVVTGRAVVVRREAPGSRYALEIETGGGSRRRRRSAWTAYEISRGWRNLSHRVRPIRTRNAPLWQLGFLELLSGRLRNGKLSQLAQGRRHVELRGRNRVNGLAERVWMLLDGAQRGGVERRLCGGISEAAAAPPTCFSQRSIAQRYFLEGGPLSVF